MNETIFCPKCKEPKVFKNQNSYYTNRKKNRICKVCRHKEHSEKLKGRKRIPFSDKWKRNIAIGHKKSKVWVDSMNTPEYKEIHRQKMIRLIKEGRYGRVGYNLNACKAFDFINEQLCWSGQHAKNGGEKSVNVFILDYYYPTLNIAIEWDEKHHKKAQHKRKDWFKQKIVTETIGCEFYRIDDVTKTVRKVDKNPIDRTAEIQTTLNEYYENKK
jgi:hypothetical protein